MLIFPSLFFIFIVIAILHAVVLRRKIPALGKLDIFQIILFGMIIGMNLGFWIDKAVK